MVVDLDSQPKVSWKQILLGKGVSDQAEGSRSTEVDCTEDFEFLEGDVKKTMVNDLDKHLVSQVLVNGELLWVEYEALPTICFSSGKYGHLKEMCPSLAANKGNETRKISGAGSLGDSINDMGSGLLETDSRFDGLLGKMNAIMGQNQDGGGSSFPTDSAGLKALAVVVQEMMRLGLFLLEGMVVVLDGNVLDLGKHSMVIFKETPNPNKGEVLKDRGDDEVGKEVPTPKVRGSSDKGGTNRSGRN
ncbi:hypothetical protein Gotri_028059 [Gossypium trilobum]|uniref:CCHC-type domain-containing protein n=1 Tax=Gossypium trilobum TaxID=34281 RepID=A0A7J9FH96_9ROSI|nr:hypothetical protein [Gossypium trilobum]